MRTLQPAAQATVLGRAERVDIASAALINGITSHTFDFDDTHLKTIIHPAGPVASAALALAELTGASGRQLIDSLVIGIDVACRIGNTMYPDHYDRGWHITGSTGMFGAAAACSRLLHLDQQKTAMALGIAASQPIGVREQFGTMTKPFHPGGAARAGMMAALLAKHGFTASSKAIEAPRGFVQVVSDKRSWSEVTDELGERFEISFNTYKPFACGVVITRASTRGAVREVACDREVSALSQSHSLVWMDRQERARGGLQGSSALSRLCCGTHFGRAASHEFSDLSSTVEVVGKPEIVATVDQQTKSRRCTAIPLPAAANSFCRACKRFAAAPMKMRVEAKVTELMGRHRETTKE